MKGFEIQREISNLSAFLVGLLIVGYLTGCTGLGVRAEMYRIDQTQSSSRTFRKPMPIKCYFIDCSTPRDDAEVEGS